MANQKSKSDLDQAADKLQIPPWGRILTKWVWRVGIGFAVAVAAMFWQLVSLNRSVGRLEGQIERIPASVSQKLLEQSRQLADSGKTSEAVRAIQLATAFIRISQKGKIRVDSRYFEQVSQQLHALTSVPQLSDEVHAARMQLADYKSALQPIPKLPAQQQEITSPTIPVELKGGTVLRKITPGDFFLPPITRRLSDDVWIHGGVFLGAVDGVTQTLDGIHWVGNVFINVRIKYEGGEVQLQNVTFINCTFEITNNERGLELADYVVLGKPDKVVIGQGATNSLILHYPTVGAPHADQQQGRAG